MTFPLNRDKISYPNLDSARTTVPHNDSMPPPVPILRLDVIGCSANEDNSDKFIFANSTDLSTILQKILSYFHKNIYNLIRNLCHSKEKAELLASRFKKRNTVKKISK